MNFVLAEILNSKKISETPFFQVFPLFTKPLTKLMLQEKSGLKVTASF
jgi:hypothetical protein